MHCQKGTCDNIINLQEIDRDRRRKLAKNICSPYNCFCKFLAFICCCFTCVFCPWVKSRVVKCDVCDHMMCRACKQSYHGESSSCEKVNELS